MFHPIPSHPLPPQSHPLGGIGQICHKPRYADAGALNKKTGVRQNAPFGPSSQGVPSLPAHSVGLGLGLKMRLRWAGAGQLVAVCGLRFAVCDDYCHWSLSLVTFTGARYFIAERYLGRPGTLTRQSDAVTGGRLFPLLHLATYDLSVSRPSSPLHLYAPKSSFAGTVAGANSSGLGGSRPGLSPRLSALQRPLVRSTALALRRGCPSGWLFGTTRDWLHHLRRLLRGPGPLESSRQATWVRHQGTRWCGSSKCDPVPNVRSACHTPPQSVFNAQISPYCTVHISDCRRHAMPALPCVLYQNGHLAAVGWAGMV